jgi:glycosyltransferase involved in cell wall biosynthesis
MDKQGKYQMPRVSVVVPFLNEEKFLQDAIESVLEQTYTQWELLLIDDGSTDNSTTIAIKISKDYPDRVYYLEHEAHQNRGVCASRNLGIAHAKGEYIATLDADDVWLPHKLERQVEILNTHPEAAMVYGTSQYWRSWTGHPKDARRDYIRETGLKSNKLYQPGQLVTRCYPLGSGTAPCPSDILFRREILEKTGGFEEEFAGAYQLFEDQAFLIKIYLHGAVYLSNECWDRYRLHPDSCMSNTVDQFHTIRKYFLNWLINYLGHQRVTDPKIWKAVDKAFWQYNHPVLHNLLNPLKTLALKMKWYVKFIKKRMLLGYQK